MSNRKLLIISVGAVAVIIVLLLPSLIARAIGAGVILIIALILMVAFRTPKRQATEADRIQAEHNSSAKSLAFSKLFEATMSGMREGLLVVDKDMRVVASNPAAHRLFNLSRGRLNAHRLTELTRNPAIYGAFLDALKGTERSGVKIQMHGPERLVFDLRVVPLGGANGRDAGPAQGALGVFVDVTRLDRLEQVRQEFLSNVSHELRTPLTAILAFVETLEAGAIDDGEAGRRFLSIIRKNALRMQDLIDDILELSAIEAGNVQVKGEQVELHPIVSDVVSSLAAKADSRGVRVINATPRDSTVFADARKLEQMLTNLVENAIKFNRDRGKVTIRYETGGPVNEQHTGNRDEWPGASTPAPVVGHRHRIIVEDTGEGIPAQHLERLFERFYRVDRARSRELGGTGLGLAIVKHLARAHQGEVTVTSDLGKGTVFTIELPQR